MNVLGHPLPVTGPLSGIQPLHGQETLAGTQRVSPHEFWEIPEL